MSAASMVACPAVDALSHQPITSTLIRQLGGADPGAILVNAQQQVSVLARAGEVTTALGKSMSKLESFWKLSDAGAGAARSIGQIQGCFGDVVGQGRGLAGQIQAAGSVLQNALRILEFVKAANKAVAALMCTPWTIPAAKVLATATAATTIAWLAMVAQMAISIGQAISALQQATQSTDSTAASLGNVLGGGTGTTVPPLTPPTFPTQQPAGSVYPAGPPVTYPTVTNPTGTVPQPQLPTATDPAYSGQYRMPTVQDGWIPRGGTQPTPGTTGNPGGGLTIEVTDSNHDGKADGVKVHVPEGQLDNDLKIHVDGKFGGQKFEGDFDIDAQGTNSR